MQWCAAVAAYEDVVESRLVQLLGLCGRQEANGLRHGGNPLGYWSFAVLGRFDAART